MNRVYVAMYEGVEEPAWFENVEPFVQKALSELKFDGEEISMLLCNDEYMQQLNKEYRQIDSATDVLSFENDEEYEDDEGRWLCRKGSQYGRIHGSEKADPEIHRRLPRILDQSFQLQNDLASGRLRSSRWYDGIDDG